MNDPNSWIESVETHQTGGNIYVDHIILKSGHAIEIGEDGISVYKPGADREHGEGYIVSIDTVEDKIIDNI